MPIASPSPRCHGYILAHQDPQHPPESSVDPYHVVPCPFVPTAAQDNSGCTVARKGKKCHQGAWCERHWCGSCKVIAGLRSKGGMKGQHAVAEELKEQEDVRAAVAV